MKVMKKKITEIFRRKIRSRGGFSILEMLLAMIILLLATELVVQSMNLAAETYISSTNRSKAQMIMSTLSDFVRSTYTTASDIVVDGGDTVSFLDGSGRLGGRCTIVQEGSTLCLKNKKGKIYYPIVGLGSENGTEYANGLRAEYTQSSPQISDSKGKTADAIIPYSISVFDKTGKELASGKFEVKVKVIKPDD